MNDTRTIQFRVVMAKNDERVDGPDDADTVATIAKADAAMDPTVAFMRGLQRLRLRWRLVWGSWGGRCRRRCRPRARRWPHRPGRAAATARRRFG